MATRYRQEFFKKCPGRVMLGTLNLDGAHQGDLRVHGRPTKAVYVYPSEHYDCWKHELPEMKLPWGRFGANFTTGGLLESELNTVACLRFGVVK